MKGLPAFGGAASVGENIIANLKDEFDFYVYSMSSHTVLKTGFCNGYYQKVFRIRSKSKFKTIAYYIKSAFHVLFFGGGNIVHLHHRDASFILPLLRIRNKVVLTTHGMELTDKWNKYHWAFKLQDKLFLRLANSITTVSLKDKRIIDNRVRRKNANYIPNGINLSDLTNNTQPKTDILFASGRILYSKGLHLILEALKKNNFSGSLDIAGDLSQNSNYSLRISELSKEFSNITFLGLIKEKEALYKKIRDAKIFVYPSMIESMSMMLLEVASLKTPIICADIPENRDIFSPEEVLFFKSGDVEDLARKIDWAFSHYDIMLNKASNALNKLTSSFLWKDITQKYRKAYFDLL